MANTGYYLDQRRGVWRCCLPGRNEAFIEIKPPNSLEGGRAKEVVEVYLRQAEKALALTRETLLAKKKSPPEKIAMGMLIKETTGLNHKDIATLLNMGHPVRSARLINEALKTKDLDSPVMRYYDQLIQVVRRQWGGLSAMSA